MIELSTQDLRDFIKYVSPAANVAFGALIAVMSGLLSNWIQEWNKRRLQYKKSVRHVHAFERAFKQAYFRANFRGDDSEKKKNLRKLEFLFEILDESMIMSPWPALIDKYLQLKIAYTDTLDSPYPAALSSNLDKLTVIVDEFKLMIDTKKFNLKTKED